MIDPEKLLDPAASPESPARGVRRVNNVPLIVLGVAVAIFLGILVSVASSRASQQGEPQQERPKLRSTLSTAREVAGTAEAGTVPAAGKAPTSQPSANGISRSNFPPPPLPPRLAVGRDDEPGVPAAEGSFDDNANALQGGDEPRELAQLKLEMFKQALTAKTTAKLARDDSAASEPMYRANVANMGAQPWNDGAHPSYGNRMDELRAAGVLQEPNTDAGNKKEDAYAGFAGDTSSDRWALDQRIEAPSSPYELRAGAVIPATLQTGIDSDLPGQITAIVAQDVRDTPEGKYVLIPQGCRLVGSYDASVKYGQARVLVAWQRILWPDGKALDIGAMPGADGAGYAGFEDQVDTHMARLFSSALLMSGITAGISMTQDAQSRSNGFQSVGGTMAQALGQQLGQVSMEMIRKNLEVSPTIKIRPGYRFNVQVTKDLVFSSPYRAFDYKRTISVGALRFRQRN